MSGIPRYRMTNSFGYEENNNGAWVKYTDHVDAVELKRREVIASVSQIIQDCLEDFLNEGEVK